MRQEGEPETRWLLPDGAGSWQQYTWPAGWACGAYLSTTRCSGQGVFYYPGRARGDENGFLRVNCAVALVEAEQVYIIAVTRIGQEGL